MLELAEDPPFLVEKGNGLGIRAVQHEFNGHTLARVFVQCPIHGTHAATANLALNLVTVALSQESRYSHHFTSSAPKVREKRRIEYIDSGRKFDDFQLNRRLNRIELARSSSCFLPLQQLLQRRPFFRVRKHSEKRPRTIVRREW